LDEDQAFYLQSRGLSPEESQRLLVAAYFAELAEDCPFPKTLADLKAGNFSRESGQELP
jgi:Fe-S cluster assembly scaffold protein SufB